MTVRQATLVVSRMIHRLRKWSEMGTAMVAPGRFSLKEQPKPIRWKGRSATYVVSRASRRDSISHKQPAGRSPRPGLGLTAQSRNLERAGPSPRPARFFCVVLPNPVMTAHAQHVGPRLNKGQVANSKRNRSCRTGYQRQNGAIHRLDGEPTEIARYLRTF